MPLAETPIETVTEIQTALHHVHLPKLAETGFIQYDSKGQVEKSTGHFEQEESYLSAILAMDSELSAI